MSGAEYSSAALAYLGDAVIEILARTREVESGVGDAGKLNRAVSAYVTAAAQSAAAGRIEDILTEEEAELFRRGRNKSAHSAPKNAKTLDYRRATGLETLFGALWLDGKRERAKELFDRAFEKEE